jgi:hypothetical protein
MNERAFTRLSICAVLLLITVTLVSCGGTTHGDAAVEKSHLSSTTSAPPTTTNPALQILSPQKTPPVSDECSEAPTYSADGNASPLICPNGGVNAKVWSIYASDHLIVMQLGPNASASQVYSAMCADAAGGHTTNPIESNAEQLVSHYDGWSFGGASEFTDFLSENCPATTTTTSSTGTTFPTYGLSGYGATMVAWDKFHSSDGNYQGFPAYGSIISTPEGPTPQFIGVMHAGNQITQFIEVLPTGTSVASAKQIALQSLPYDSTPLSFYVSYQNGSCAFWNLSSPTLTAAGMGADVTIEMAYDDSNGAPHYEPNDINALTFEAGSNDSSGTC